MTSKFSWMETHKTSVATTSVAIATRTPTACPTRKLIGEPFDLFQKLYVNKNFHYIFLATTRWCGVRMYWSIFMPASCNARRRVKGRK